MLNFFRKRPAPSLPDEPPIAYPELKALFDHLDQPNPAPCTRTFQETVAFLRSHALPVEPTLAWLGRNGAWCDCEVIFNTEAEWGERVGRVVEDDDA